MVGNFPLAIIGALNAHSNLVRAMGPECRCAVRNAAAARVGGVHVGCRTKCCSPPQAATLHAGVRHVIIKAEAHEGPLRCTAGTGRREGALRMWLCVACVVHPSARCVVRVGRAAHLFGSCCGE